MTTPDNTNLRTFTADDTLNGVRLDLCLIRLDPDLSRSRAQALIKSGLVSLNGTPCRTPKSPVAAGDVIVMDKPPLDSECAAEGEDIPLDVLYEDDDILVINKPAGMVVHPAAGNWSGTVVNAVLGHDPDLAEAGEFDPQRPGIVHRLDKDTSGCLVIAKNPKSLRKLARAFEAREVHKTYLAIVHGWPVPEAAVIHTTIDRHPVDRKKMTVARPEHGRDALTSYRVIRKGYWGLIKAALVQVRIFTGRTHQIRVHMSYKDYPVLGDKLYAKGRSSAAPRQMLHAWKLELNHPRTGEPMVFESPLPPDFQQIADAMTPEKAPLSRENP